MKQLLLVFCLISGISLFSQDLNFSQVMADPVGFNPANTGLFLGKFRGGAMFKTQWASVTTPYTSVKLHSDMSILRKGFGRRTRATGDWVGFGFRASSDKAGDGNLNVIRLGGTVGYHKSLDQFQKQSLSVGGYFGIIQRSIDYSLLYFEDQWNGEDFETGIASIDYNKESVRFAIDYGLGAQYNRVLSNDAEPLRQFSIGAALMHPLGLSVGFNSSEKILKQNPQFNASAIWSFSKLLAIEPVIFAQLQNKSDFIMAGSAVVYNMSKPNSKSMDTKLIFGAYGRLSGDAIIQAGLEVLGYRILMSYDMNFGAVSALSNGKGGFELSILKSGPRPKGVEVIEF